MKKYTSVYLHYFGFGHEDFVPCEICGERAVDIAHIKAKSVAKDLENNINNLMGSCRRCHTAFGDKKEFLEFLQATHRLYMTSRKPLWEMSPQTVISVLKCI